MVTIGAVRISINEVRSSHTCFTVWILDSGVTNHCSGNRSLFPETLKKVNEFVNTVSEETLTVENLEDITIPLSNGDTVFSHRM